MKALLIKYHGPTNTKPARLSVQSEGYKPVYRVITDEDLDEQVYDLANEYFTNRFALDTDEQKYAIGVLPNGDYVAVLI